MDISLLNLNGYGLFVWPAFAFTIFSCFYLYLKTANELKKVEKIYLADFEETQDKAIVLINRKRTESEAFSIN